MKKTIVLITESNISHDFLMGIDTYIMRCSICNIYTKCLPFQGYFKFDYWKF